MSIKLNGTMASLEVDLTQGINGIALGENIERFVSLLGKAEELIDTYKQDDGTEFYQYYRQGISIRAVADSVDGIFYYFQRRQFTPFEGKFLQGVHKNTTPTDLIKLFGEPDYTSSYLSSGRGEFSSVQETNFRYDKHYSLYFVFYDDRIADVRHTKRKIG